MSNYSYADNILRINLTTQKISIEDALKYVNMFLRGKGINTGFYIKK